MNSHEKWTEEDEKKMRSSDHEYLHSSIWWDDPEDYWEEKRKEIIENRKAGKNGEPE